MRSLFIALCSIAALNACAPTTASTPQSTIATYLGNEAVMISDGETKILLDPLFPNGFGVYQQVPDDMRTDMMNAVAPYDGIDAIFVSHMHPDHFSVEEVILYLERHTQTRLYAPQQAVEWMREEADPASAIFDRVTSIALERLDAPVAFNLDGIKVDAVRIPHAGWPGRADISNLVYRITLSGGATVMHMGDADPNDEHYAHHGDHWHAVRTDTAFPPYWFFNAGNGPALLADRLNTDQAIGVHVPLEVPLELLVGDDDYLHEPGETRIIGDNE
jgi:L-ascorbate metabolism protein UlaG (beta-lactamase superfamily)